MPTPVFLTTWEHGVVITGATPTPNERIWHAVAGTLAQDTTENPRSGASSLKASPAANASYCDRNIAGAPNVAVLSYYVKLKTLPATNCTLFAFKTSGSWAFLGFITASSKLCVSPGTSLVTRQESTNAISADTWYRIDLRATISGNPWVLDWAIDGVAQTQFTPTVAAGTFTGFRVGGVVDTGAGLPTYDCYVRDLVISVTSGDYPLGAHEVLKMSPNADGTHSFTANDFIRGDAGAAILVTDTDVWTLVDDAPLGSIGTTDSVQQNVIRTTGYVELHFADAPSAETAWGVQIHGLFDADATGADTSGMRLWDGTTEDTLYGPPQGDVSNTSATYLTFCRAVNPSGGAWDTTALNGIRARWGFSGDVTGSPILHALMLEAAFPIAAGGGGATGIYARATHLIGGAF